MQSSIYCEQHCHGCVSCSRSCSGSDSCPHALSRALALVLTLSLSVPLVLSLALALALALTPLSRSNLHTLPRCCPCCRSGSHSRSRNLSRSRSRSRSSWFLAAALARSLSPLLWFMTFASDVSTSRLTETLPTNMSQAPFIMFVSSAPKYIADIAVAVIASTLYADKRRHREIDEKQTKTWKSNVNVVKMSSKHRKKSLWGSSRTMKRSMNRSVHAIDVIRVWNMRGFSPVLYHQGPGRKRKPHCVTQATNRTSLLKRWLEKISNRIPLSQIMYTNVQHGDGRDWIVV